MLVPDAAQASEPPVPPSYVTLTATPSSVTEPDSVTLTATSDGQFSRYWIDIIDDDSGQTLRSCSPGGTCSTFAQNGWSSRHEPRVRRFHAQARSYDNGSVAASSGQVAVDVRPYPFELSLTSTPSSVTEPDTFTLTATTTNNPISPHWVDIFDEDTGTKLKSCGTSGPCRTLVSPAYHKHNRPGSRHYRAEIRSSEGDKVIAEARLTVDVQPYPFEVTIGATPMSGSTPPQFTVTAASNGQFAPFNLNIIDDDSGATVKSCSPGGTCNMLVAPGTSIRRFHAEIRSQDGTTVVARSAQLLLIDGQVAFGDDIDLAKLAGLFTSIDALCLTLQAMPGVPNSQPDSPNDLAKICLAEQAAGKSMVQILAAVIARGGVLGVPAWLIFVATPQDFDDGNPPWYPPPHPPDDPPYNGNPPTTMPAAWDAPIAAAAERIHALNPALALDAAAVREIAKRCVWLAAQARRSLSDCGQPRLPIFVTGGNVMDVTRHDLKAIGSRPGTWMKLNYDGVDKSRAWLLSDQRCKDLTGEGTGMHCHEYPYNKTEQGGQSGAPSIAPMPISQNLSQGGSFGIGISRCAMRPGLSPAVRGDAFLVVPVPVEEVPTAMLCNGKSASSQPQQPPSPGG